MSATLISPSALARMRALSDANMPYSAAIQSFIDTSSEGGTHTQDWATVATVACRLSVPSADERIVAEQPSGRTQWLLVLPAGTEITAAERVVVTGTDAAGNAFTKTLQVLGINAPLLFEVYRRVVAEEVANDAQSFDLVATVTVTGPADLAVGDSGQFSVELRDADDAVITGRAVAWSTSDPAIATVDASGLVTRVAAGNVAVMATREGVLGAALVVTPLAVYGGGATFGGG